MHPSVLSRIAQEIGQKADAKERFIFKWRPFICPFHLLLEYIPEGACVLDVGCGSGLWLLLLSRLGRIRKGIGMDVNPERIALANNLRTERDELQFLEANEEEDWPKGKADCLTMIDVLHHVPKGKQKAFLGRIESTQASRVIFKDIDPAARIRRTMNTLHDWVLSRQIPQYSAPEEVISRLREMGYDAGYIIRHDMLWYRHYLIVADKK